MGRSLAIVAAALAALLPCGAAASNGAKEGCTGTLSGDVKARFDCTALLGTREAASLVFAIRVPGPVEGVPSVVPGAFELRGPAEVRTYTLDDLGLGKASVAVEGGHLYTAAKTSSRRGEVTLTFTSVRKSRTIPGAYDVHGTYRARLLPVGGGTRGEVVVDVKF